MQTDSDNFYEKDVDESIFIDNESDDDFIKYCKAEDAAMQRKRKGNQEDDLDLDGEETPPDSETSSSIGEEESDHGNDEEQKEKRPLKETISREEMREKNKELREKLSRTIFVGNLSSTVDRRIMVRHFSKFGKVENVRIRGAVPVQGGKSNVTKKAAVITKEFAGGVDQKLFAFLVFTDVGAAKAAQSLNNTELAGLIIRVDMAGGKGSPHSCDNNKSVFVGNLPFTSTEEQVRAIFQECGEIVNVRLVRDRATGNVKGFGFVEYSDLSAVSFALKLSGVATVGNRQVRVLRMQKTEGGQSRETPRSREKKDRKRALVGKEEETKSAKKRHPIIIPTNIRKDMVARFIRRKQKKLDGKRNRAKKMKQNK